MQQPQLAVWSAAQPPRALHPAPGFAAIVDSARLAHTIPAVLACGGWVIAATIGDELVGYASIVRPVPVRWMDRTFARRWDDRDGFLELGALEVARPFRSAGIGGRIAAALALDVRLDHAVLFGIGVMHHWDLGWPDGTASPHTHRRKLAATLRRAGMAIWPTDDPEVALHAANALFARVGAHATPATRTDFTSRLWARA